VDDALRGGRRGGGDGGWVVRSRREETVDRREEMVRVETGEWRHESGDRTVGT
jgi:hypothetical protein